MAVKVGTGTLVGSSNIFEYWPRYLKVNGLLIKGRFGTTWRIKNLVDVTLVGLDHAS